MLTAWSLQQYTGEERGGGANSAGVFWLTTRSTCIGIMESVTHLVLFVAIGTRVCALNWEHHLVATET